MGRFAEYDYLLAEWRVKAAVERTKALMDVARIINV
jgi:hypothetical protein